MYDKSSTNPHSFNSSLTNVPRRKKNNSNTFGVKVKRAQLSDPAELFVVPKMKSGINFDEDERT